MNNNYYTCDIKLASCLIGLGVPRRNECPVTREVQERNGKSFDQFTFWFDIADEAKKTLCGKLVDAYEKAKGHFLWESENNGGVPAAPYILGVEHPLYYMMGVLFNRETYLHQMRSNAEPMKFIKDGNRTIMMSTRASQKTKDKIKSQL